MNSDNNTVFEYYIKNNLPQKFDTQKVTELISDLLDDDDRVIYYIPGSKIASEVMFTLKKVIIAQRFPGEWGGDIILPYEEIKRLKIRPQNRIFFIKLDLMVDLEGLTFYVKKSEADSFRKIMWNLFEVR